MPSDGPMTGPTGYDRNDGGIIHSGDGNQHGITPPSGMPDTTRKESGGQTREPGDVPMTPSMSARPAQVARRRSGHSTLPVNQDNSGRTPIQDT